MLKRVLPTLLAVSLIGCAADAQMNEHSTPKLAEEHVAWRSNTDLSPSADLRDMGEEEAIISALRGAGLSPVRGEGITLTDWGLRTLRRQVDELGNTHIRLGLTRGDVAIEGMGLNISLRGGRPYALLGTYSAALPQLPTLKLASSDAITLALTHAKLSRGELKQAPVVTPVIISGPEGLTLAHRIDLRTDLSEPRLYIQDADSALLSHFDRAHHGAAQGSGPVLDTDELQGQSTEFPVYDDGSQFFQRDTSRGSTTIRTYDVDQCGTGTSLCGGEAKSLDNSWPKAHNNSAHSLTGQVLDFWAERYGLNSFDDRGTSLRVFQMQDSQYDNAYWNGVDSIVVGDGSYSTGNGYYDFLSRGDIMAHELGHAVEGAIGPDLLYRQESGALAESIGDMAGVYFERWLESKGTMNSSAGDWLIGEDAIHPDSRHANEAMRDMSDPKRMQDPDTYRGAYWLPTESCDPTPGNDNCGVHSNSGVPNFAFYLLSEGGEGVNDHGYSFDVPAIGMTSAHAVVFQALRYHMHEGTGLQGYYDAMVLSAGELFGAESAEAIAVAQSLKAVGLRIAGNGVCELGESAENAPEDCDEGQVPTPEPTPTEGGGDPIESQSYVDDVRISEAKVSWVSYDMTTKVVVAGGVDGEGLPGALVSLRVEDSKGGSQVFEGVTGHDGVFAATLYKVRRGVTLTACVESIEHPSSPWAQELDADLCDSERAGR